MRTRGQISQRIALKRRKIGNSDDDEDEVTSSEYCNSDSSSSSSAIISDEEEDDTPLTKEHEQQFQQLRSLFPPQVPTIEEILQCDLVPEAKTILVRNYLDTLNRIDEDTPGAEVMFVWHDFNKMMSEMNIASKRNSSEPYLNFFLQALEEYRLAFLPNLAAIACSNIPWDKKAEALEIFRIYHNCKIDSEERAELSRRFRKIVKVDEKHFLRRMAISKLPTTEARKEILYKLLDRETEDEHAKSKIDWYLQLPYTRRIEIGEDNIGKICTNVYNFLEKEVYGLRSAKEAILRYVNDHFRGSSRGRKQILALKGNPGTGKTKIASTIAKAVGLPFEKISMGGVGDATILRGSRAVWIGAEPSLLLQKIITSKCCNPVVLFDEIDKISTHGSGREVHHALLHILDYEQNNEIQDGFLGDITHDLSNVWFIATMNDDTLLDPALKDRLRIIEVPDYTKEDTIKIIQGYTLPKVLHDRNLRETDIAFTAPALQKLLQNHEPGGMRTIESKLSDIISRIALWAVFEFRDRLLYKVPNFNGYPYTIDENAIVKIMERDSANAEKPYHPMYS